MPSSSLRIASLLAAALLATTSTLRAADPVRHTINFDAGWSFLKGDLQGAESPSLQNAQSWPTVNVPQDWAIEGPFNNNARTGGAGALAPSGVSWYRKTFTIAPADAGKKIFINFDGIMANADVWINGFHLGKRPYGYVPQHYELTEHLINGNNLIAVRTDTTQQPASRYYEGAGIFRHVRLVATNALHIDADGTFVTTPKISKDQATVHVRSTLINQAAAAKNASLQITLLDPEGKTVATAKTEPKPIAPTSPTDLETDVTLNNPAIWDIEKPVMYTAVAQVLADGKPIDDQSVPFGIRQFEFKPATGFWLNDKNFKLKGVCLHADTPSFGVAVPEDEWIYRLTQLKNMGANAVRTAHNPPSPEFLDACDKVGMLVMDEMFDCWTAGKNRFDYSMFFREWNLVDTRDIVRRDRNHPSIILYSAGNEIHDTPNANNALAILRPLVKTFHDNDPTRPVTQALFRPNQDGNGGAYRNGLSDLLDVVGTNYRNTELIAAWRAKPTISIVGTENTKDAASWNMVRNNPAYAGHFIWTGVDYLGEARAAGTMASPSGIFDMTDRIKAEGLQMESWWNTKPMVNVVRAGGQVATGNLNPEESQTRFTALDDWTPANLNPHQENVQVFSNCDSVELFLNNQSLGAQPRGQVDSTRTWRVNFAPGTLKAVAKNKGEVVATRELTTAGKPAKIVLISSTDKLFADYDSVAHITAIIADDKGIEVPGADNQLTFKINGPGIVSGVATGVMNPQNFKGNQHYAYMGQCEAFVHATAASAPITLTVSSAGLADGTLTLTPAPARN